MRNRRRGRGGREGRRGGGVTFGLGEHEDGPVGEALDDEVDEGVREKEGGNLGAEDALHHCREGGEKGKGGRGGRGGDREWVRN